MNTQQIVNKVFDEQGLTQGDFAEALGVSRMTVYNWLGGKFRPTYSVLVRLQRQYPVSDWRGLLARQLREELDKEL